LENMELILQEPLSLSHAITACNAYRHLKGNVIISESGDFEVIENIVCAPYDKLSQTLFLKLFKEMKDATKALAFYNKEDYSVVLILKELVPFGDAYYKLHNLTEYLNKSDNTIRTNALQ
jgi:hypothetical protein